MLKEENISNNSQPEDEKYSNKEIYKRTIEIPYPYTLKHAASWIKRCTAMQRKKRKTEINFAIDKGGMAVGGIGIKNIIGHQGEIGYWLGNRTDLRAFITIHRCNNNRNRTTSC